MKRSVFLQTHAAVVSSDNIQISTYFPRKVLWRAFLCSLTAAIVLKQLNPTGTGKLVLFETNYGTDYDPIHYLVFILLGISGGIFGGLFCKLNFAWSKYFRRLPLIKNNPVLEVILVVLATTLLQFPNPLLRDPGDMILKSLLIDCKSPSSHSLICAHESSSPSTNWSYIALLTHGTLTKLALTILTFGIKVPSGIIIPALDAGALFGRLTGYLLPNTSSPNPGIFALVGAAAFLAGTTRMTISLAVIMFELTGQLDYVVPHMVAILVAKWTADAVSEESVYDIAQTVLGHPFLDAETALRRVRGRGVRVGVLVPTRETMRDITVVIPISASAVPYSVLKGKLDKLRARGLMDAGLVLVQSPSPSITPVLRGYISQAELAFGLESCLAPEEDTPIHLLPPFTSDHAVSSSNDPLPTDHVVSTDLSPLVDRTPLSLHVDAPLEYAVEMFGKLGVRYLIISGEVGSGEMGVIGVVVKKRMVGVLEGLS
jgi:chloride channel 3/4/5